MEVKKYVIADSEFTMKFPSYKRCERVREVMGDSLANMIESGKIVDVEKFVNGVKECLDGNFDKIIPDELTLGQMEILSGAMLDFFTLSREIK